MTDDDGATYHPTTARDDGPTVEAREGRHTDPMPHTAPHPDAPLPESPPGFVLRAQMGHGGMGVVYRAEQDGLRREVALKMPLTDSKALLDRFASEAVTTGYLEHPNIVPVHLMGHDKSGRPYFTMKLVHGIEWGELLHPDRVKSPDRRIAARERARQMDQEAHLRILSAVCNAVAFAHARGIVHRDLKPENVMVGDFGEVLVMDWGIAVDISETPAANPRAPHRNSAGVAGSPYYMAPEMALGWGSKIDGRTDVYLLGGILFEILTGQAPRHGIQMWQLVDEVTSSEPKPIKDAPAELAAICQKALARDREDRFPDVKSFQAALESYLKHRQSILLAERALEEEQGLTPDATYEAHAHLLARYQQALELWDGNEPARAGVRRARLVHARTALARGDLGLAEAQLQALAEDSAETAELARSVAQARARRAARVRAVRRMRTALGVSAGVLFLVLSLGYLSIRAQHRTAELRLAESLIHEADHRLSRYEWDTARERALESWRILDAAGADPFPARAAVYHALDRYGIPLSLAKVHKNGVRALAFSPDGLHVASCDGERVLVREVLSGHTVAQRASPAPALAFGAAGIALGGPEPVLWDWRADTVRAFARPASEPERLAFTPDGARVIAGGGDGNLTVWDVAHGTGVQVLRGKDLPVRSLVVSADGRRVFSAGSLGPDADRTTWDLSSGRPLARVAWSSQDVSAAAFAPDGALLLSGGRDEILRVYAGAQDQELRSMTGHRGPVTALAFSPDGAHVASGGQDSTVRIWDPQRALGELELGAHHNPVSALAWSPDGSLIVTGAEDGEIALWRAARATRGRLERDAAMPGGDAGIGVLSADGRRLATASVRGALALWDLESGRQVAGIDPSREPVVADSLKVMHPVQALHPGRAELVVAYTDGLIGVWSLGGKLVRHRKTSGCVAFAADGSSGLAVDGGTIEVLDPSTASVRARFAAPKGPVTALAVLPGGQHGLIAAGTDLHLVTLPHGRTVRVRSGRAPIAHLRVAPDGSAVLALGMGGSLLLDAADLRRKADLPRSMVASGTFSLTGGWILQHHDGEGALYLHAPDGTLLRTVGEDLVRYGLFARPVATADDGTVVSFSYLTAAPPFVFRLGNADRVRALLPVIAGVAPRVARTGDRAPAGDWAMLARWYATLNAPELAKAALARADGRKSDR